jgi:hypothetical protein
MASTVQSVLANVEASSYPPSLDQMIHSLHLAGAAYCSGESVESWSCGVHCDGATGVSVYRYFETTKFWSGTFAGFVAYDAGMDSIVVSVRGTDNSQGIQNWVANLDAVVTYPYSQYPDAGVHEGFYNIWVGIKDEVLKGIDEVMEEHGKKVVHITGHSMGGAVATDAALDLVLNHGLSVGAYTYGSPRAGERSYADAVVKNLAYHVRITHKDDLVAHVPPKEIGFYHPPREVHFYDRTGLDFQQCDASNGEDLSCADACSQYLTCTSIDDHLTYLDFPATCGEESLMRNMSIILV